MIDFINRFNRSYWSNEPFVFIIDFELKKPRIWKLADTHGELQFHFSSQSLALKTEQTTPVEIIAHPAAPDLYQGKYDIVMNSLLYGDTFLTNLTIKTKVECSHTLNELFHLCKARYKFYLKDSFLCFSPETFVRIEDGMIYSYPMKGTIDASIPDAAAKILSNQKEMAEHVTIVDLIRNDLSMIAEDVRVTKFRYIDEIKARGRSLLQVSSEIPGKLLPSFNSNPAGSFLSLLPAGSISGAPKAKTLDIIRTAEREDRGYYTGICGYFDGRSLDSAVMIRFIEKENDTLYYRSGGGITTQSDLHSEYQEALDKIYVPIA